jgi:hypothetical protein
VRSSASKSARSVAVCASRASGDRAAPSSLSASAHQLENRINVLTVEPPIVT